MRRSLLVRAGFAIACLTFAACAGEQGSSSPPPAIDWTHPFGEQLVAASGASSSDVQRQLPFPVPVAADIGDPAVFKDEYSANPSVALAYPPRSGMGPFLVEAWHVPDEAQGAIDNLVAQCQEVCTDSRYVTLPSGSRGALLVGGTGPNSLTWLTHGLMLTVIGPEETFSAKRAIAVARLVDRAAMALATQ